MSAYTYGDYDYFNNIIDTPEIHHLGFILNKIHAIYITYPLKTTEETFYFSELFVLKIEPGMNYNIQIFDQLSKVNVWNQHNKQVKQMYYGREELIIILSYVFFENYAMP